MLNGLITRRFIGYILTTLAIVIKPEVAPYLAGVYGALIGVAVVDSIKGSNKNG
jgi:hypothetical protein